MRIAIRSLRDDTFFVEVEEQATIFGVKAAIFQMNGVFPAHQSIIYKGNILSNDTTLPSLNFPLNKQPSLYLVISKEQRERIKKEKEEKNNQNTESQFKSPPKPDLFSSFSSSMNQEFGSQNSNSCFDSIMKNITDKSPNFSHALNDKEALYESYDAFKDPEKRLELLKSIDRTLNLVESKAGCYRDIIQHQRQVTEAVDDAIDKYMHEINPSYYENLHKTVIPEKPLEEPSCEPIQMDLNNSNSFMDNLLQRQLMLVMTLPNGEQKLVAVKKNADAVLKIMQLMTNLQAKSQKKKSKQHSPNKFSDLFLNKNLDSNKTDDAAENDDSQLDNGMKQLEVEGQMNLLKILMMSLVSSENSNDNDDSKTDKKVEHFEDEYDYDNYEKRKPFGFWNKLISNNNNSKKKKQNKFEFSKQPTYDQIFHSPSPKSSPPLTSSDLVDIDSESDSSVIPKSQLCLDSSPDYQQFLLDEEDSFFDDDFFMNNNNNQNNNSIFSSDPQGYAQPRSNGHRNTAYYSPTKNLIQKDKVNEKDIFIYDSNESSNYRSVFNDDETEKKRKEGWEIIYDIANGSCQNNTNDDAEKSLDDTIRENNSDQNDYSKFNNNENDDDSDISID